MIKYGMMPARTKVTVACNNCQRRKIKCSGKKPCERCAKQGFPCRFLSPTKKRGPKRPSLSVILDRHPHFQPSLKEYLQMHPDTEQELKDAFHGGKSGELPEGAIAMLNGAASAMQDETKENIRAARREAFMEPPAGGYRAIQPRQHAVIFDDTQISPTSSLPHYDVQDATGWTERWPRLQPSPTVNKQPILHANDHMACQAIPSVSATPSLSVRDAIPPTHINDDDVWTSSKRKRTIMAAEKTERSIHPPQLPIPRPQHQTTPTSPLLCCVPQRAVEPPLHMRAHDQIVVHAEHRAAQPVHHAQMLRRPDQPLHHPMQIRRHTEFPSTGQLPSLPLALPPTPPFNYPVVMSSDVSRHASGASGLRARWEPEVLDACGELVSAKCNTQFQNTIVRLPHLETHFARE